jgi:DNA-binding LacI/PurR family transcriptional regulator
LAGGATGRVALVLPHISRWFFSALLEGLESVFRRADLDVLLYHVGGQADRHDFFERLPARRKVDAVVVLGFPVEQREQERLALMGVEVVAAGGQHASYPFVCIDDVAAGRQAMNHLLNLGHRRIAMIAANDPEQPGEQAPQGRANAYYTALAEAGIPLDEQLVVTVDWGGSQGADAMAQLLSLKQPPTAVYAHSDEVALGAIRTLRRAGLRIPDAMSIIGIDDHPLAELTDLTTIRQPVREQGARGAQMVLDLLNGEPTDRSVTMPTRLVIRGTTAPPATLADS